MAGARVKVSLAFQLSLDSDVVRRKKVLSLQATDSVQKIYETISGRSGGPPLWPKDFGEMLDNGDMDAELYYGPGDALSSGGSSSASAVQNWQPVLGSAVLSDLAHETSQGPSADLLLRIVEPRQTLNLDGVLGDDRAMYYSRTFLHFKETESDDQAGNLTPRALSDPISQRCSTPMSRVSSRGSLGLLEQAEQERQHRLHCEDYIQRKLLPHLARSGERSRDESERQSRSGAFSPLHVGTQNLNLSAADRISTHISPAQSEEPAYLPSRTQPPAMSSIRNQAPEQVPPTNLDSIKTGWGPTPLFMYGSALGPDGVAQKENQDNQWAAPAMPFPQMASLGTATSPTVNGSKAQPPRRSTSSAQEDDDDEERNGEAGFASQAEELFDIVSRNDLPALDRLLRDGVDVNECTAKGSHVLFRAVIKARELDMVLMLLQAGADARCTDDKGNQVMHFWARATVGRNHLLEMGQALLMAGAEINAQRLNDGMSPLHHVVVGHNNRRGWLDFHKALMLVRHGASIHLRTRVGQLPLSLIAVDGRAATKKLMQLLQYGIPEGSNDWPRCDHVGCAWCQ